MHRSSSETVPFPIASLQDIADNYDAILCDVWGVITNGVNKFAKAEEALSRAGPGRPVVLVTNSPRRAGNVADFLRTMGMSPDAFDAIATSGDVTRELVKAASPRMFHIGIEAHRELLEGLSVEHVGEELAEVVLVTGLFDDENQSPGDYHVLLQRLADRQLPMICANPDVVALRGDRMIWCAGALARSYAALGGDVQQVGKPFPPIYDFAASQIGGMEPRRVLAIGDGLMTDIKGANDNGLDALLILQGIDASRFGDDLQGVAASLHKESLTAQYVMPTLM